MENYQLSSPSFPSPYLLLFLLLQIYPLCALLSLSMVSKLWQVISNICRFTLLLSVFLLISRSSKQIRSRSQCCICMGYRCLWYKTFASQRYFCYDYSFQYRCFTTNQQKQTNEMHILSRKCPRSTHLPLIPLMPWLIQEREREEA